MVQRRLTWCNLPIPRSAALSSDTMRDITVERVSVGSYKVSQCLNVFRTTQISEIHV